ncbi:MAG: FtsX-like permease family protein, partial [Saprospiraceae bacterium]|nr:FtsX-like permease family protein [Saprospiraceae bacterium]
IINYVNLSTAQATERAKEVAIRKVTGANKNQLIRQFLTESILQALLASLLGLGLAEFFLPIFETIVDRDLQLMGSAVFPMVVLFMLLLALFLGILSGIYPALGLSSLSPVNIFQNKKSGTGAGRFRRILVTAQFSISIGLLILMAFIYKQVNLMLDHDLGFKPHQVVKITLNDKNSHRKIEQLRTQFMNIPGVTNVTTSSRLPGQSLPDWGMAQEGVEDMLNPRVLFTDPHFLETLDIPLVSGRFLSSEFAADTVNSFIVNEAFVQEFNLKEPLGTKVKFSFEDEFGEIVGVCQNFHYSGLQSAVAPLAISGAHNRWYAAIQLSTTAIDATIDKLKDLWRHIEPEHPIRLSFLDEEFEAQYREHQQFGRSILYATILTLIIALMGLFGLTTFSVQKRLKEIGIRKVLGASTSGILFLFSRDFIRMIILAFLIGAPLSLFFTNKWLENFATRIQADVWTFAAALAIVLMVTMLTVGIRTFAAARSNPVESLRDE